MGYQRTEIDAVGPIHKHMTRALALAVRGVRAVGCRLARVVHHALQVQPVGLAHRHTRNLVHPLGRKVHVLERRMQYEIHLTTTIQNANMFVGVCR